MYMINPKATTKNKQAKTKTHTAVIANKPIKGIKKESWKNNPKHGRKRGKREQRRNETIGNKEQYGRSKARYINHHMECKHYPTPQ